MDERIKSIIHKAVDDAGRIRSLHRLWPLPSLLRHAGMGGLLSDICAEVLDDPYAFARFKSQAKIAVQNGEVESELPYVATLMESEVNHELFASDEFAAFREDHSDELTGDASPMKIYVADKIARARLVESAETEKLARRAGKSCRHHHHEL